MARKKAHKKKKRQARVQAAPKSQAPVVGETNYVESGSVVGSAQAASKSNDWSWQTYVILAAAAVIILFAGWLVIRSLTTSQIAPPKSPSGSSSIPISGEANPQQLQAGTPEVQSGGNPGGASSSENNGLQEPQSLTPEQLQGLQ
ncbi:MAG: hypothetical protein U0526_04030 [Candidatus Saccharibacteria bacterium]